MDRTAFIEAMRGVANSVAVVTTDGVAGRHGATVSAFCSVSADPPTVLVCLKSTSHISELVRENECFKINVLPDSATHIANRFAGVDDSRIADRFEGIDICNSRPPSIAGATTFECELDQCVPSGSHQIVIGRVTAVANQTRQPLTYLDGAYHQVTPFPDYSRIAGQ